VSIADAADQNLAVHATWATRHLPNARVRESRAVVLVDSGLPCDTYNFICRARLGSAGAREEIRGAIDFFGESGHPFSWWLGPGATPDHLGELLQEAGLAEAETELAMSLDLAALGPIPPAPAGFEIRRVRSQADLDILAPLLAANWDPPDSHVLRYFQLAASQLLAPNSAQWYYLGWLDGVPVATAELTVGGGVVGLYGIGTIPAARGKGIGSLMTAAPLHDARRLGHTTAILQAAEAGQNLYARLGFVPFGVITEFKP
jgi:GNAT superfamily N-acetyltransferase